MARRKGKRKGGRKNKAFPILAALPVAVPLYNAYKEKGLTTALPENYIWQQTGWSIDSNRMDWYKTKDVVILAGVGFVGHKVANKIGLNRMIKKIPMVGQYLQL
jgi:hypothetical protein